MNRQFQNYNNSNDQMSTSAGRNVGSGGRQMYMDRPSNLSQSQYDRNQGGSARSGNQKQAYNPNPFNGRDMVSMSSQMSGMLNTETAMFNPTKVRRDETQDSEKKKEIGVLFYSNNCDHSKTFLLNLMKSNVNDLVRKICVDNNSKIPSVVKSVPTLVARGINRPLVGEQVFAWLENENTKVGKDDDIKCFSFNCKDNYTFIEGVDDGTIIDGNIADWDKDYMINAPLDTAGGKDSKKGIDEQKIASYKNEMMKIREDRGGLTKQNETKNSKLDPDQFNQMFLKQQEKYSKGNGTNKFKQSVKNI